MLIGRNLKKVLRGNFKDGKYTFFKTPHLFIENISGRVPTVAHWIKNLTAVALVTAEVQVQSLAWCSEEKDPALQQLQCMSQLQLRLSSCPGTYKCQGTSKKEKRKKKKKTHMVNYMVLCESC